MAADEIASTPFSVPPTRFVLARHGEAGGNRELRYLGTTDAPLTERGVHQARQLADAVPAFAPVALYSSPLARARATAEAISAATNLPIVVEPELREQSFGAWELLTHAEALERDRERLLAWEAGEDIAPPEGESLIAVRERALRLAERLVRRHPGETIALVSHVSPLKALVCAALDLPPSGAMRMWLDLGSISVLDWRSLADGGLSGTLRVFNAIAHLDPPVRWLTR
jgi:probable phosphoglycerate mutase